MKLTISSIALAALVIVACSPSKKSTSSTATTTPSGPVAGSSMPVKSSNGVYSPGNEELAAIQVKYKDVTMRTLSEGYYIYTGVCTNCHPAKNIYSHAEESWPAIMDDMALRSRLTATEKDAVYKYVLSIKATQPK